MFFAKRKTFKRYENAVVVFSDILNITSLASFNRQALILSRPLALLGFSCLIPLETNSSEIATKEKLIRPSR
jgi:hypothetical protein